MGGWLILGTGIVALIVSIYFFPVVFSAQGELNATTNITEYTGLSEAVSFAPLGLYMGIVVLTFWAWWKWHSKKA